MLFLGADAAAEEDVGSGAARMCKSLLQALDPRHCVLLEADNEVERAQLVAKIQSLDAEAQRASDVQRSCHGRVPVRALWSVAVRCAPMRTC